MRVIRTWLLVVALLAVAPAYADGISGTYVGQSSNGAFLIQIVQTIDGRLTGRYVQVVLKDGKLEEMNATITGASDGQTIAITLKPNELLSGSFAISGTIKNSSLHMTGGGYGSTITLDMTKADEAAFRAQVANLVSQVQQVSARRAFEDALSRIQGITKQMNAFVENTPIQLAKFAPIEERYRFITESMRRAFARQQSIYGDGQASVARGQIAVAINQAGIESNQIHISMQSAYSEFDSKSGALLRGVSELQQKCQTTDLSINGSTAGQWKTACLRLATALPGLHKNVVALREAFARIERIWQEERAKQEPIIRSADATR